MYYMTQSLYTKCHTSVGYPFLLGDVPPVSKHSVGVSRIHLGHHKKLTQTPELYETLPLGMTTLQHVVQALASLWANQLSSCNG